MPRRRTPSAAAPVSVPPPAAGDGAPADLSPAPSAPVLGTWDAVEAARDALDAAETSAAVHIAGGELVRAAQHYTAALLASLESS